MNSNPRSILFISSYYLPVLGGIEQFIAKVAGPMLRQNTVTVAVKQKGNERAEPDQDGVKVKKLSALSFLSHPYSNYDAVYITNFSIAPHFFAVLSLALLNRSKRPKVIFIPHGGVTLDWAQFPQPQRIIKQLYNSWIGFPLLRRVVDTAVLTSNWEKTEFQKLGITKNIKIIRNGIDRVELPSVQKQKIFVFVGRIDPIKNIEGIIQLFGKLSKREPFEQYRLLIIGDGTKNPDYFEKLQRVVEELNLLSKVDFTGPKIGVEKLQLIASSTCLFCLSHVENDPVAVKEAFSVGTKVIVSGNKGLADLDGEPNAYIASESSDLAELEKYLSKPFLPDFRTPLETWNTVSQRYEELV